PNSPDVAADELTHGGMVALIMRPTQSALRKFRRALNMRVTHIWGRDMSVDSKTPLRLARERLNLTIQQVSQDVGIDAGNLSRIERGVQTPTVETAAALAAHFGISELEILYPERFTDPSSDGHESGRP
ncbi:MAG TPA: helix-turn-helix transcriptional regulator, partial [Pseudomonadales bacterium]